MSAMVSGNGLIPLSVHSGSRFKACSTTNTRHWLDVGLMLGHRLRRWPSINPMLAGRTVFVVVFFSEESRFRTFVQDTTYRRLRIGRDGHLDQSEVYDIS